MKILYTAIAERETYRIGMREMESLPAMATKLLWLGCRVAKRSPQHDGDQYVVISCRIGR